MGTATLTQAYVETGLGPTYNGQVIVIISGSTVSAGEIFTMTMALLPQTIRSFSLYGYTVSDGVRGVGVIYELVSRTDELTGFVWQKSEREHPFGFLML